MIASSPMPPHPFHTYTSEILAWQLGPHTAVAPATHADPSDTAARAARLVQGGRRYSDVVLLGLGTGDLAAALAARLPPATRLTVVCGDPDSARRALAAKTVAWLTPHGRHQLLADTSEQALFCLLLLAGIRPDTALITLNPEPGCQTQRQAMIRLRRLLLASRPAPEPQGTPGPLTLAVLLRPDEPQMDAFFQAACGLADAAVLLWDADTIPPSSAKAATLGIATRHLARRLNHDFAAQRNALLDACPKGWVLTLDPDERPEPDFRRLLHRAMTTPGLGGVYVPRATLHPATDGVMAGYGLWPDLQLRFFANDPPHHPRYSRPVHERLEHVSGATALALGVSLTHHNRLVADDAFVAAKLDAFSQSPDAPRHRLNAEYPSLPRDFFTNLTTHAALPELLLLPKA